MVLTKILAVCLIAAVLILLLRDKQSETAFLCAVAAGAVVLWMILDGILPAARELRTLWTRADGSAEYFRVAWKTLGIAYLTGFAADTCRDFGQSSLASKAELAGKITIFLLCLPMLVSLLDTALRLTGS